MSRSQQGKPLAESGEGLVPSPPAVEGRRLKEGEPQPVKVEDYPPRPYWEALSDEHRAVLAEAGQLPPKPPAG